MNLITVLLADDHTIVREGLRALLKLEAGIKVIGEAENGQQAVELACKLRPDVVVMDFSMPLLNGLEAARRILQDVPLTKVIMLTAHSDDAYVKQVLELGVTGYLIKQTAANLLPKAIRAAFNGKTSLSPSISKRLNHHRKRAFERGDLPPQKNANRLTLRETEILRLITEGRANKDVAKELNISIKTVDHHRQNLAEKLNIHEIAGLTRYAIEAGITKSLSGT